MSGYLENFFSSVSNLFGGSLYNTQQPSKQQQRPSTSTNSRQSHPLSISSKSKTIQKGHKKRPHILSVQVGLSVSERDKAAHNSIST